MGRDGKLESGAPLSVLVVEDDLVWAEYMGAAFDGVLGITVSHVASAADAAAVLANHPVDMVVTDILLPDGSGIDVTRIARRADAPPAVMVVTGHSSTEFAIEALRAGADDFLAKPFGVDELLERTRVLATGRRRRRETLAEGLATGARRLALALTVRDRSTGEHSARMSVLCSSFAARLGMAQEQVEAIGIASPLHDIGKLAVPDAILHKPGPLDPAERRLMQTHTTVGHEMLSVSGFPLLDLAATIALTHHECFDGSGYPHGLAGEEIPLEGRITMLADVFDALTSERPYRAALSIEQALALMSENRGTMFDPLLHDVFVRHVQECPELGIACEAAPAAGQSDLILRKA